MCTSKQFKLMLEVVHLLPLLRFIRYGTGKCLCRQSVTFELDQQTSFLVFKPRRKVQKRTRGKKLESRSGKIMRNLWIRIRHSAWYKFIIFVGGGDPVGTAEPAADEVLRHCHVSRLFGPVLVSLHEIFRSLYQTMADEVVVDALPYIDHGYDDPGVRYIDGQ